MILALASALVQFLWQGALLGLGFAVVRPFLLRAEASTRYVALLGILALAPLLVLATFRLALDAPSSGHGALPAGPWVPRWAYVVTSVWAAGVATLGLRTVAELRRLLMLRATGLPLRAWHGPLDRLRERLGVATRVRLAESPAVETPLVTGWLRPMVLLPLGLTTRMPPAWIESILAHELAHVRRYDVVLGILQRAVEVSLFFHPVVWWVSSEIRRAREEACDDLVVDALQSPIDYARALTELAGETMPTPALAMGLRKGSLMSRIEHIVTRSPAPVRAPRRLPAVGVAVALGIVAGVGCLSQLDGDEDARATDLRAEARGADARPSTLASASASPDGLSIAWLPERVVDFEPQILAAAQRHDVDPNLVAIIVLVESGGDPQVRSPGGARGLMQVMPETAAGIAAERGLQDHTEDKLDDPAYNLDLGTWFLARQLEAFGVDPDDDETIALAAAAYNAGPPRLREALQGNAELSDETRRYRSIVRTLWSERELPQSSIVGK